MKKKGMKKKLIALRNDFEILRTRASLPIHSDAKEYWTNEANAADHETTQSFIFNTDIAFKKKWVWIFK